MPAALSSNSSICARLPGVAASRASQVKRGTENASANHVTATFWVETVKGQHGKHFLQLQYTQTVMLDFNGLRWPHVSVATLRKTTAASSPARNDLPTTKGAKAGREVELS